MLPDGLARLLLNELGFRVLRADAVDPGQAHNNRLFHVWSTDGREVIAKCYFHDDRQRLDREYTAFSFLQAHGFSEVPRPYLRDDARGFAVYSFEPGTQPAAADLTVEHMQLLASFAARLRRIRPATPGARFRCSVPATFSLDEQASAIRRRLQQFEAFVTSPVVFEPVRVLVREMAVAEEVERRIRRALAGLDDVAVHARVPPADWSLSSGDLAPHNLLVRPDGSLVVLDLEYSGWDDPAIPVAEFLSAETSRGLSPTCAAALEQAYTKLAEVAPAEVRRARRVRALLAVAWLAIHLSLLLPERITPKRFADPRFDLEVHLAQHIQRFRQRLLEIDALLDGLLVTT